MIATAIATFGAMPHAARADDNAEARVYFERGNRALERGMNARGARRTRFIEEALAAYVQSLSIVRSRNVVYNAGIALEALGRDEEAFAYFREYLGYSDLTDEERREATQKLTAIRTRVAVVMVTSTPEGAQVHIDRRDLAPVGVTPLEVAISEGDHTIYISAEGYGTKEAQIHGAPGQRETVSLSLRAEPIALVIRAPGNAPLTLDGRTVAAGSEIQVMPGDHEIRYGTAEPIRVTIHPGEGRRTVDVEAPEGTAPAGPPGLLAVSVNVPATVYVDDQVVETGREVEASVASGPRTIRVEAAGYSPATQRIDIPADGQTHIRVRLEEDVSGSSRLGKWPGVFLAVGGFTAIAAAGIGMAALFQHADWKDDPARDAATADHIESLNVAADVTFGIGAALAATGLILAIINGDEEQAPSRIDVAAAPIDGGGVVVARGSWGTP
jgi:hypothetical protein